MLEDQPRLNRTWTVGYEALVADPRSCLAPVLADLGLSADMAMEPVVDANAEYFDKWQGLDPATRADIVSMMSDRHGDVLARLCYRFP
jgi:hypothetical protein